MGALVRPPIALLELLRAELRQDGGGKLGGQRLTRGNSEAWRYTGPFTRANRFKGCFPGLGTATVAFAIYCGVEYFFFPANVHHGEEGHGEAHGEEHH